MSQENVEIVKRALEAFNGRRLDSIRELTAPDFEWSPAIPGAVDTEVYRGSQGAETYFEEIRATWRELQIVVDEFRDLGSSVLTFGRIVGRGMSSGIEVDTPLTIVFELRGGKVARSRGYLNRADALKAVGLEE